VKSEIDIYSTLRTKLVPDSVIPRPQSLVELVIDQDILAPDGEFRGRTGVGTVQPPVHADDPAVMFAADVSNPDPIGSILDGAG
jgi:hypothetical protein